MVLRALLIRPISPSIMSLIVSYAQTVHENQILATLFVLYQEDYQPNPYEPKKLAVTNYKLLRQFKDFAQVLAVPETGRTNQIRIHFKELGHPLLGESRFAFRRDFKIKFKRVALHASRLVFSHPVTNEKLDFYCELPADLKSLST